MELNATAATNESATYYLDIAQNLKLYIAPLILFGGTAGNIITIIVVLSRHFRHSPSSILLLALAIVDIGVLYSNLLDIWLGALLNSSSLHLTRDVGWFACKLNTFLTYYLSQVSSWILVLINIERVFWLYASQKANVWCTKRRLGIALGVLLAILFLVNLHLFWTVQFHSSLTSYKCQMWGPEVWDWASVDSVIFSYIPFVIILSCNIALIVALLRHTEASLVERDPSKANHSIIMMLMAISIVFLITTSPLVIAYQQMHRIEDRIDGDPVARALYLELIVNTLLVLLCYSNNALNFFLYCLSGAKFRRALKDICRTGSPCCDGNADNQPLSEDSTSHISMETR